MLVYLIISLPPPTQTVPQMDRSNRDYTAAKASCLPFIFNETPCGPGTAAVAAGFFILFRLSLDCILETED